MTQQPRWNQAITVGSLAFILGWVLPVGAETSSCSESVITPSPEFAVISNQRRLARQLGRKALAGLEATSSDAAIPIEPSVIQAARDTYVLIRAARHAMTRSALERLYGTTAAPFHPAYVGGGSPRQDRTDITKI